MTRIHIDQIINHVADGNTVSILEQAICSAGISEDGVGGTPSTSNGSTCSTISRPVDMPTTTLASEPILSKKCKDKKKNVPNTSMPVLEHQLEVTPWPELKSQETQGIRVIPTTPGKGMEEIIQAAHLIKAQRRLNLTPPELDVLPMDLSMKKPSPSLVQTGHGKNKKSLSLKKTPLNSSTSPPLRPLPTPEDVSEDDSNVSSEF